MTKHKAPAAEPLSDEAAAFLWQQKDDPAAWEIGERMRLQATTTRALQAEVLVLREALEKIGRAFRFDHSKRTGSPGWARRIAEDALSATTGAEHQKWVKEMEELIIRVAQIPCVNKPTTRELGTPFAEYCGECYSCAARALIGEGKS